MAESMRGSPEEQAERAAFLLPFKLAHEAGKREREQAVFVTQEDRIAMVQRRQASRRGKPSSERTDSAYASGWCEEDFYRHMSAHRAAQDVVKQLEEAEDLATGVFMMGDRPVEVTPFNPEDWVTGRCEFVLSHVGACGALDLLYEGMCENHRWKECFVCHDYATHDCPDTFGPMVCGAPLCPDHEHCGQSKAHEPSSFGTSRADMKREF